jgi:hypothetical protein
MQNQEVINTLISLGVFGGFPTDYEYGEEILDHLLQSEGIDTDDINLQQAADTLNNYFSDKLFRNQGVSEDASGVSPTSGYMVSLAGTEVKHPNYSDMYYFGIEMICREYWPSVQPNAYFGAWIDEDILYLDNSVNIADLETAIAFGHANKQIAIWDVTNGKSIYINK